MWHFMLRPAKSAGAMEELDRRFSKFKLPMLKKERINVNEVEWGGMFCSVA